MKKLTEQEVSVFCAELSMLLSSGMSLEQGIIAMEEEEKTEDGKRLLSDIYEQMEVGSNLYNAMKETECFPTYVTDTISSHWTGDKERSANSFGLPSPGKKRTFAGIWSKGLNFR